MKIIIQSLRGERTPIEIDDSATVLQLREQAALATHQTAPPAVVFKGKQLEDGDTLSSAGLTDGSLVIYFNRKKAPAAEAPASAPPPTQAPEPQPSEPVSNWGKSSPSESETHSSAPTTEKKDEGKTEPPKTDDSAKLDQLVAMGFPRSQAEKALRAAFGNTEVAVNYLTNGIPEDLADLSGAGAEGTGEVDPGMFDQMSDEELRQYSQRNHTGASTGAAAAPTGELAIALEAILNGIRQMPQLPQIRAAIQRDPNVEEMILQQLVSGQPQLAQLVQMFRPQFHAVLAGTEQPRQLRLLKPDLFNGHLEEIARQNGVTLGSGAPAGGAPSAGPGGEPSIRRTPQGIEIAMSPEDMANVEQIIAITGCSKNEAVQAYIACERNLDRAINFIMDS